MGGRSKSNTGQAELVAHIVPMLTKGLKGENSLNVTVLSPYTKQVQALKAMSLTSSTIDSFQGRECDIVIFSAVRCNSAGDVGFLDDERRLNVMWTRPKHALIIIGDRATMVTCPLWKRAIESCTEVKIDLPSRSPDVMHMVILCTGAKPRQLVLPKAIIELYVIHISNDHELRVDQMLRSICVWNERCRCQINLLSKPLQPLQWSLKSHLSDLGQTNRA